MFITYFPLLKLFPPRSPGLTFLLQFVFEAPPFPPHNLHYIQGHHRTFLFVPDFDVFRFLSSVRWRNPRFVSFEVGRFRDIPNTREWYRLWSAKSVQVTIFFSWTSVGDFLFKTKIWDQFDLVECFTHDVFVKLIEIGLILTWKEICLKPEWSATTSLYWKF